MVFFETLWKYFADVPSVLLVLTVIMCLLYTFYFTGRKYSKPLPPAPGWCLPLIGHLLLMKDDMRGPLTRFRAQLGDIYSLYLGNKHVIIVSGYPAIKQMFTMPGEMFDDRADLPLIRRLTRGRGLVFSNGVTWKQHRRFMISTLKDLGMGRSQLDYKLQEEAESMTVAFGAEVGKEFDPKPIILKSVVNIVCHLVFAGSFQSGDPKFDEIMATINETLRINHIEFTRHNRGTKYHVQTAEISMDNSVRGVSGCRLYLPNNGTGKEIWNTSKSDSNSQQHKATGIANYLPVLMHLPGDPCRVQKITRDVDKLFQFIYDIIDDHLALGDEQADSFVKSYLAAMERQNEQSDSPVFSKANLASNFLDLVMAGTESATTVLRWCIVCLLNETTLQTRMFTEINEQIGHDRLPSVHDRPKLPFVEAFINEVLRFCNVVMIGLTHCARTDTVFRGFTIPKSAIIIPDLTSVTGDVTIWGDPQAFRPDRFLDESGKFVRKEEHIPFFLGRRSCPGESLARMELFLYLTSIVQRFKLEPADGCDTSMTNIDGEFGTFHGPKDFLMRIIPR